MTIYPKLTRISTASANLKLALLATPLAVVSAMATPTTAAAKELEIQLRTNHLSQIINRRVIQAMECPTPIACHDDENATCYIDHVDVPVSTSYYRTSPTEVTIADDLTLDSQKIVLIQPVALYRKTLACIRDPDCPQDEYDHVDETNALVQLSSRGSKLCTEILGFGVEGYFPDGIDADDFPQGCMALNTRGLSRTLGLGPSTGGALSMSGDGTRVAMRLEFIEEQPDKHGKNPASDAQDDLREQRWQSFLDGELSPIPTSGLPLSVFVPDDVLESLIENRFENALNDTDQLELDGYVDAHWTSRGRKGGQLKVEFTADVDVPVCPDIGMDVAIDMDVSLKNHALVLDGKVDWDVHNGDVLLCANIQPPNPALATAATIALGVFAEHYQPDSLGTPGECSDIDKNKRFTCTFAVPNLPSIHLGPKSLGSDRIDLGISSLEGHDDGLIFDGTVELGFNAVSERGVETVVHPLAFGGHGGCSSLRFGHRGRFDSFIGGRLCKTEFSADPLGVYDTRKHTVSIAPQNQTFRYDVNFGQKSRNLDAFWDDPYQLRMTLWTTSGAATWEMPLPERLSQTEIDRIRFDALLDQQNNCHAEIPNVVEDKGPNAQINPWDHEDITSPFDDVQMTLPGLKGFN